MTKAQEHAPNHPDNRKFVDFAQREIGSKVQIDNFSRDFGRPSIAWRLTGSDGSRTWLKHHEKSLLYQRELIGLEQFVPALGEQTWWSSSTLVVKNDEIEAILVTDVPGKILDTANATPHENNEMFRLAGKFIRKLHDVDLPDPEGTDTAGYLRKYLYGYFELGKDSIDTTDAEWARELLDSAASAGDVTPVPCHMDYSPRNWLIDQDSGEIRFGIIDWERTRRALWLNDVQRMVYDHWRNEPDLRDAYFEGYGRSLTATEDLQLDALCLVSAIASIPWAISHNDENFEILSRRMIELIKQKVGT